MTTDFDVVFDQSATFAEDDPLAPVHAFIGEVRATYGRLPAPEPRGDLAALFGNEPERAAVIPLRPLHSTAGTRTRRLRRAMLVAATLALAVITTGGLAAAGALPDAVQNTVSDILDRVGIDVPHDQPPKTPPPIASTSGSTRSKGAPAAPAEGNAGTPSSTPASREPTLGSTDPTAAPDTTVPPTSTTTVPGVPPPLPPVEPTLPIDLPLPPLPVDVPLPPLPVDVPLPPLPVDVPLPPLPVDVPLPPLPVDVPLPPLPVDVPLPPLPVDVPLPPLPVDVPLPPLLVDVQFPPLPALPPRL